MKNTLGKLLFPSVLIILGIIMVVLAYKTDQNWQFKLGAYATLIAAIVFFLNVLDVVKKIFRLSLLLILVLSALGLSYLDYKSIKDPIEFGKEKDRRYIVVVQRLKDIRTAQIAYKAVKGKYASDFDSLFTFIKYDSLPVIKAIGTVPDTLTEEEALKRGLVQRDTSFVSAKDSVFSTFYLKERANAFVVDSLAYIPFSGGEKFDLQAGQIERNKVNVHVFEVVADKNAILNGLDPALIRTEKDLKVGSMTDPNTSGNWGE